MIDDILLHDPLLRVPGVKLAAGPVGRAWGAMRGWGAGKITGPALDAVKNHGSMLDKGLVRAHGLMTPGNLARVGAVGGALHGAMNPGYDEEGNRRSAIGGAARGAGMGAIGGVGASAVGNRLIASHLNANAPGMRMPKAGV
jgi:hypothetical protein